MWHKIIKKYINSALNVCVFLTENESLCVQVTEVQNISNIYCFRNTSFPYLDIAGTISEYTCTCTLYYAIVIQKHQYILVFVSYFYVAFNKTQTSEQQYYFIKWITPNQQHKVTYVYKTYVRLSVRFSVCVSYSHSFKKKSFHIDIRLKTYITRLVPLTSDIYISSQYFV